MKYTHEELKELQSLPLGRKIEITTARIIEYYNYFNGKVYISFSGGKDSTVLLDIVRRIYPDTPAVFCDTGLEYPEIREFVKKFDNVTWLHPVKWDNHKKEYVRTNFREVIQKYGYPVATKQVSQRIHDLRNYNISEDRRRKFLYGDGNKFCKIPERWKPLIDAPFEVGDSCCDVMKKTPFKLYEKQSGRSPILGIMTAESLIRKQSWLEHGCNVFSQKRPLSRPLSFWTEQDILQYLITYRIPYCSVYGKIVENNGHFTTTGCKMTGCMFCMYGIARDKSPNRFERMKETHPNIYNYCMKPVSNGGLGLDEVLNYINIKH